VALCVSVVSFPLMLDRHAGAGNAMVTSLRAAARNPVPMAAWGLIVAVLLVAGSPPFFLDLAIVIPVRALPMSSGFLLRTIALSATLLIPAASALAANCGTGSARPEHFSH
jgi:uncharacterized membrane protein